MFEIGDLVQVHVQECICRARYGHESCPLESCPIAMVDIVHQDYYGIRQHGHLGDAFNHRGIVRIRIEDETWWIGVDSIRPIFNK